MCLNSTICSETPSYVDSFVLEDLVILKITCLWKILSYGWVKIWCLIFIIEMFFEIVNLCMVLPYLDTTMSFHPPPTQLTHLPKFISYDVGNLLVYRPIYYSMTNESNLYLIKRSELTSSKVMLNFLCQSCTLPFQLRTDEVAVVQHDFLHDPSIYIINRKSLMVNKPHVFYNNDLSDVHCLPLVKNTLK